MCLFYFVLYFTVKPEAEVWCFQGPMYSLTFPEPRPVSVLVHGHIIHRGLRFLTYKMRIIYHFYLPWEAE